MRDEGKTNKHKDKTMKMSQAFPSKYLKAADLNGREVTVTIEDCHMEKLGEDTRPVLYFRGKDKGLVLNKTNAGMIADSYGDDSDNWSGQPIIIYPDKTLFQGQMTPCLRVRVPAVAAAAGEEPPF